MRFEAGGVAVRERRERPRGRWSTRSSVEELVLASTLRRTTSFRARSEGLAMLADMFGSPFDSETPPDVLEFLRNYNNRFHEAFGGVRE